MAKPVAVVGFTTTTTTTTTAQPRTSVPPLVCNYEALIRPFDPLTSTYTCFGEPLNAGASLSNYDNIDPCICLANVALILYLFVPTVLTILAPPPAPPPPNPIMFDIPGALPENNTPAALGSIFPAVADSASCKDSIQKGSKLKAKILRLELNCSSQPSMVHWLSSSIFPCLFVRSSVRPAMVTSDQISTFFNMY